MEESFEKQVLIIMVALWLDQRLTALIHDRNKISKALGLDGREEGAALLSVLTPTLLVAGFGRPEQRPENVAARVIAGFWVEGELDKLKRDVGRISKTMGLRGHQVSDFSFSLSGKVSELLRRAYEPSPPILYPVLNEGAPTGAEGKTVEQNLEESAKKSDNWLLA